MPDPTIADLIGCQITGFVVVGSRHPYGEFAAFDGTVFDSADDARGEAESFQYVAALVQLEETAGA